MDKRKLFVAGTLPKAGSDIEFKELKSITELILKSISAEKIICFGSILKNIQNKSCFIQEEKDMSSQQLNSYYILIVPAADEIRPDVIIQQRIEEGSKAIAMVTVIVHRMEEINLALQNGSSFFTTIYRKGMLLYDQERALFVVPAPEKNINKRIIQREQFWHHWRTLSENFIRGARYYASEQINALAVFMLHQALQHCYSGMLRVLTGYRSNSNGLRRLLKLVENILPESSFSFSKNTPEDARLTGLLLKGFGDARYSEKFEITIEEVVTLIGRIQQILVNADAACLKHIQNLKEGKMKYVA